MNRTMITWWIVGVLVSLAVYGVLALGLLKKNQSSSEADITYPVPLSIIQIKIPESWHVEMTPHSLLAQSGKKDGKLIVQKVPRNLMEKTLRSLLIPHLVEWDRRFTEERISKNIELIENLGRDPISGERRYISLYRVVVHDEIFLASYESSVLFGLVDGYQIKKIILSLSLKEETSFSVSQPQLS